MSVKYTFKEKRTISRKIADITYIDRYRQLLKAVKSPASGRKMLDKQQLAVSLVYELLAYYSESQLQELTKQPGVVVQAAVLTSPQPSAVKKKPRNSSSTRISAGSIWTILWSGLRTAYLRTVSIFITAFRRLKKDWTDYLKWTEMS